jgi:diguanylate cyclase (GGDEF)-like protein
MEDLEGNLLEYVRTLDLALHSMQQGLLMFDQSGRVIICNDRYLKIYGLSPDEVKPGSALIDVVQSEARFRSNPGDPPRLAADTLARIRKGEVTKSLTETTDGRTISTIERPVRGGGWVVTYDDVSESQRTQTRIAYLALHDALTGLSNREQFHDRVAQSLRWTGRRGKIAVLFLDIDNFRAVNDTLGHPVGDDLLKETAARLQQCVASLGTVARLGGDEFGILQVRIDGPSDVAALARRLQETVSSPYELGKHHVLASASIGIALAPDDGVDTDDLLKKADIALYGAKTGGRSTYKFFEREMDDRVKAQRRLELDLRKALATNELELHYQPIINLATDLVCGCEALLRWNHRTQGFISPTQFIPLAEETGLIGQIGEWVMRTACAVAATWPDDIKVAVNVSPAQFKTNGLLDIILAALRDTNLPPYRLEIEITEALLMQAEESTLRVLHRLREIGVRIAMDDFGTGFSSLSYLQRFPFDKIKIDQSFVRELSECPGSDAIIRTIANLASQFRMTTTAEGVETDLQHRLVKASGCTEMQGFLVSRPANTERLTEFLKSRRWRSQVDSAVSQRRVHGSIFETEAL